jgi:hypothetical protein
MLQGCERPKAAWRGADRDCDNWCAEEPGGGGKRSHVSSSGLPGPSELPSVR